MRPTTIDNANDKLAICIKPQKEQNNKQNKKYNSKIILQFFYVKINKNKNK